MLAWIGWTLVGLLVLILLLLVCPVRYRCEAGEAGGFLDVILLLGLYTKHMAFREPDREKAGGGPEEQRAEDTAEEHKPKASPADTPLSGGGETSEAIPAEKDIEERAGEPSESGNREELPAESAGEDEGASPSPSAAKVLLFAWENGTIHLTLHLLRALYHHAKPQEFLITGTVGLGDPMETGIAAGCLYAALSGVSRIDWNYTEPVCRLTIKAKGRLIPAWLLWQGVRFLAQRPVRETMRYRKLGMRN